MIATSGKHLYKMCVKSTTRKEKLTTKNEDRNVTNANCNSIHACSYDLYLYRITKGDIYVNYKFHAVEKNDVNRCKLQTQNCNVLKAKCSTSSASLPMNHAASLLKLVTDLKMSCLLRVK